MAKVTIGGVEYNLRMDVRAMEMIEKEFGDLQDALKQIRGQNRKISTVRQFFRALANSGRAHDKLPEDVTGEEISDLGLEGLNNLAKALNEALKESMHAETIGGNEADDDKHDEYLEELERQEKNA